MDFNFGSLREARTVLAGLRVSDQECNQDIDQLINEFRMAHNNPPARLVKMTGRVVIWRRKARTPAEQTLFVLTGNVGQQFLAMLPALVQQSYCEFELRRLAVCARKKIISQQMKTLSHWMTARRELKRLTNTRSII